jgi:hypothetical protein
MSRSQFILGVTLLVVAGTLAFSISFFQSDNYHQSTDDQSFARSKTAPEHRSVNLDRSRNRPSRANSSRIVDSSRHDLGLTSSSISNITDADLQKVNAIVNRTRQESRDKLDKLTEKYDLTNDQRRKIFPLIVAHHKQAHPAILVNGQPLPSITVGSTLNDSIYSELDSDQQDALTEASIDNNAWWKDVVGQLEDDLNNAIDNGEMIAVADTPPSDAGVTPSSEGPAAGDGGASTHSGGNLFELLGQ